MKYLFLAATLSLLLFSCKQEAPLDEAQARKDILKVLFDQQKSWNEGNLDRFMEGYWKSDSLTFIGSRGVTYGWQNTLDNYKKGYPDQAAMGQLTFEVVGVQFIGKDGAQMIGRYHLMREGNQPTGYFTLVWRLFNGKWVIVADQTC